MKKLSTSCCPGAEHVSSTKCSVDFISVPRVAQGRV